MRSQNPAGGPSTKAIHGEASPSRLDDVIALKLRIYGIAFLVAFVFYIIVQGFSHGPRFWVFGFVALASVLVGLRGHGALLRYGTFGALFLSLVVPLAGQIAQGSTTATILTAAPLWPQAIVALFANRILSIENERRFADFWRRPTSQIGSVQMQSGLAAVALGVFMTLMFYQTMWWLLPSVATKDTGFSAIVLAALGGETIIHRGIILLFSIILGYLVGAASLLLRDRAAFRQIRALAPSDVAGAGTSRLPSVRETVTERMGALSHLRAVRLVAEACDRMDGSTTAQKAMETAAFNGFQAGTRRFLRGLIPFLPMLGFFGTVVGLATAMAALPTSSPEGGSVDISASLSGLAVKFQTTLLGIMASLIASGLLGLIEKGEIEFAAECALFVAKVDDAI